MLKGNHSSLRNAETTGRAVRKHQYHGDTRSFCKVFHSFTFSYTTFQAPKAITGYHLASSKQNLVKKNLLHNLMFICRLCLSEQKTKSTLWELYRKPRVFFCGFEHGPFRRPEGVACWSWSNSILRCCFCHFVSHRFCCAFDVVFLIQLESV